MVRGLEQSEVDVPGRTSPFRRNAFECMRFQGDGPVEFARVLGIGASGNAKDAVFTLERVVEFDPMARGLANVRIERGFNPLSVERAQLVFNRRHGSYF